MAEIDGQLGPTRYLYILFVAVFLGCTSTGRVGLCFCGSYVQELPEAQPAVVLVLKRLRRRGNGLKSHPTDLEKPGIEPAVPLYISTHVHAKDKYKAK